MESNEEITMTYTERTQQQEIEQLKENIKVLTGALSGLNTTVEESNGRLNQIQNKVVQDEEKNRMQGVHSIDNMDQFKNALGIRENKGDK